MRTRILNRWVIAVFAIGVALRLWVLTSHLGTMSADEAYTGLQAAAILDGRFPVVIDGMTYTAVAESYLYAPLVALSGVQVVTLKWLSAPGWLIAAGLLGWVVSRVAGRRAGTLAGAMVWLAPGAMLVLSTRAYVGYSTGLVAVTATLASCVIAVKGADRNRPDPRHGALAGGCAGLACYLHPMFATVALPMFAAATWPYRRHLRRWWLPAVAAAVGANGVFLVWNAVNGWPSLSQPAEATDTWLQRLEGFFTGLVPRALGLRTGAGGWVLGTGPTVVVYIVVLLTIAYGTVVLWRRDARSGAVVIAPLIMSWPLMASLTNLSFVADGRYGIITFPLLVTALAVGLEDLSTRWRPNFRVVPAALALWVLVFTLPWLGTEAGDDLGDPNEHVQRVVDALDDAGMRYALGTYWWVLPIEVISDGRIRTGTLGHPDVVLLPRTQRLVESVSEDELAYVFSPEAYAPELLPGGEDRYRVRRVAGAVVAIPRGASPPP